uniref:TSA: Wollemia nobilis Ref_Wollemi_Transcript_18946_1214 transcribed RNA sequence n=1 Tax=Wollemia nobilis TaxID=56998 RepID=A0A0C9S5K0_9CONI
MAGTQMLSLSSSTLSCSLSSQQSQSRSLRTSYSPLCRTRLLLKLDSSRYFLSTSALRWIKPQCVPLRPRRGHQPVFMILPTANPERASAEILPKWSARAIKAFSLAKVEARKMKYPKLGTELLLMGILIEGTSPAAKFLRDNGVTIFNVRDETIKLLGKSDATFKTPENLPLTEPAQKALDWAVDEKIKSGESGEVTTTHMLLGIWAQKGFAGHLILSSLGLNDEKINELALSIKEEVVLSTR